MDKQKVLLSFVEKAPPASKQQPSRKHEILALTADGKRLVRLQPEVSSKQPKCQLIGVLTERNGDELSSRRQIRIESKSEIALRQQLEANDENAVSSGKSEDEADAKNAGAKQKIPRPANAFMLFANEWRKKLAVENPRESNKDISVRLGVLWKTMSKEAKEKYFAQAREVDAEHKRKYPDYVYNPKEARLRKAMREQSRTQQQQQPAVNGPVSSRATTGAASNGQQQQQQQPVSPLPGGAGSSAIGGANRIIGPWFPLGHTGTGSSAPPQPAAAAPATHPKPILSPRVMAAHQRTLDKTKDVIRKQLQDCANFPAAPSAYPVNGAHQESGPDYSDFAAEGQQQKWHPYQNGVNAYHSRGALMSKMNSLHRGMQNQAPHPNPRAWGQFCNVPFPTSQSVMMQQQQQQRSNRHMVFLQEQQQQQQQSQQPSHCGYPTAAEMQMSYEAKMQDDLARRLHSSYSQEEQQVKTPLMELQLSQLPAHQEEQKSEEPPRWTTTPRPPSSSSSCTPDGLLESESTPPTMQVSKQPLPGFQQAFGSTEIGRFSRSELFASLVEAVNLIPTKSFLKSRTAFPYRTSPDDPPSQVKRPEFSARPTTQGATAKSESHKAQEWPTASEPQPPPAHSQNHSFARPTEDKRREEHPQDECLDLRVPSRKRTKIEVKKQE